jgi:hypothetical protein
MPSVNKALKLPGNKPKSKRLTSMKRLTHDDGVWFRDRYIAVDNECRELRKAVDAFSQDLAQGGLAGRLLAKELDARIAKIRKR